MKFRRKSAPQGMPGSGDHAGNEKIVRRDFWPKMKRFAAGLPFAEDAVAAHYCAFDRDTPRSVRFTLLGALAYFVMPADIVPDILPMIGYVDDAGVLSAAIMAVSSHMTDAHRIAARAALGRLKADGGA